MAAILELTASATNSDVQLSSLDNSKNNYLVDKLAGFVWYWKKYYDNAEKLYLHAIKDIQYTKFPGQEEYDDALAEVYDKQHKFRNIVVYQAAASELVGKYRYKDSSLKCYALYRLKHYNDAIDECTSQITLGNDMQAYYFRGMTYQDTRKIKEALHDFKIVAGPFKLSSNSSY